MSFTSFTSIDISISYKVFASGYYFCYLQQTFQKSFFTYFREFNYNVFSEIGNKPFPK